MPTTKQYTRQEIQDLHKDPYPLWVKDSQLIHVPNKVPTNARPAFTKVPSDLINGISYLEIGVDEGETFDLVNSRIKHGVDPYGGSPNITHRMSSQMFFALNSYFYGQTYDIVFIDGCHMSKIILQEVEEALKILNPGGVIILHDTVPLKESAQLVIREEYEHFLSHLPQENGEYLSFREFSEDNPWLGYNGDSWRAVYKLRNKPKTENIRVFTFADACCTVVVQEPEMESVEPPPPPEDCLDWEYFYENCASILLPVRFDPVVKIFCERLKDYKDSENAS